MNNSLIYFNRRGSVCHLRKEWNEGLRPRNPLELYQKLESLQTRYFLVMKHIDMNRMLVAPVFPAKRRDTKSIGINGKRFWVGFMEFYVVPVELMEAAPGKYLDYSFKTITAIYGSHNHVLQSRWRQQAKERMANQICRKERQRYCESERHRLARRLRVQLQC